MTCEKAGFQNQIESVLLHLRLIIAHQYLEIIWQQIAFAVCYRLTKLKRELNTLRSANRNRNTASKRNNNNSLRLVQYAHARTTKRGVTVFQAENYLL